jgi:hypothetical protein
MASGASSGVEPLQRVGDQFRAGVADNLVERVVPRHGSAERLGDAQRPVDELGGSREERDGDPIARDLAQCKRRLQPGDAAPTISARKVCV